MKQLDPLIKMLVGLIVFFALVVMWCAHNLKSDGQTFQVMSGAFSAFVGALLMWIKGQTAGQGPADAPATQAPENPTLKQEQPTQ